MEFLFDLEEGIEKELREIGFVRKQRCLRCGYEWYPRTTMLPKKCARCASPYWNRPRTKR